MTFDPKAHEALVEPARCGNQQAQQQLWRAHRRANGHVTGGQHVSHFPNHCRRISGIRAVWEPAQKNLESIGSQLPASRIAAMNLAASVRSRLPTDEPSHTVRRLGPGSRAR